MSCAALHAQLLPGWAFPWSHNVTLSVPVQFTSAAIACSKMLQHGVSQFSSCDKSAVNPAVLQHLAATWRNCILQLDHVQLVALKGLQQLQFEPGSMRVFLLDC